MSNLSFDANKILKSNVDKLMTTAANDGICIPLAAAYTMLVKQINMFVGPAAMLKNGIINNIDSMTTDAFNEITGVLNILSSNSTSINLSIDAKTILNANVFKKSCLDFNDILPSAMNNLLTDGINSINDIAGDAFKELGDLKDSVMSEITEFTDDVMNDIYDMLPETEFEMPDEINDMLNSTTDFFKENALSDALSEAAKVALAPLTTYREFIKSTGIIEMIKRLQKFERCMTNPKNCNRPKKEFYFPGTSKFNSQYYMELFAINLKGEIQMKKITKQVKGIETKAANTLKKLDDFKKPPFIKGLKK